MLRTNTVNRKAEHIKVTKAPLAAAQKNTQIIMEGKTAILLLIAYMYLKTTTANEGEFLYHNYTHCTQSHDNIYIP